MIHLVAVGLFVVKPPIYQKLVKATEQKLRKENPQAADSLFGKIKVYSLSDDLKAAIPPWYPLETASTAPRSGHIVWSHHFSSLQQAADTLQPGDTLRISEGVYKKGFLIHTSQVLIEGIFSNVI